MRAEDTNIILAGTIVSDPEIDHIAYDEKFYSFLLSMQRASDNSDVVKVVVPQTTLRLYRDGDNFQLGARIGVEGQIRTFNKYEDGKSKLQIYVFADRLEDYHEYSVMDKDRNEVMIGESYICKAPTYRVTPLGREITDLILAVNRGFNKSDYVPAIVWGRNARFAGKLSVGTAVAIAGRLQSRVYQKTLEDGQIEDRTAYEVSVSRINVLDDAALNRGVYDDEYYNDTQAASSTDIDDITF